MAFPVVKPNTISAPADAPMMASVDANFDAAFAATGALDSGGTGANLTAVAGAVAYSTATALALSAAGTSGMLLQSAGTGAPTWTASPSLTGLTVANPISGSVTGSAGSAATADKLTTARAIYGNNFDGTAALAQVIASTYGGTGNGFAKFSGPASSEKTYTLPNSSTTIVTIADTGTVTNAMLAGSIAYSKLVLTGAILNADLAGSIAYSKLSLTGAILNADLAGSIADSKLSTIATAGKVSNSATTATNANTASAIVARDASGDFAARTLHLDTSSTAGWVYFGSDGLVFVGRLGTTTYINTNGGTLSVNAATTALLGAATVGGALSASGALSWGLGSSIASSSTVLTE